MNDSGLLIVVSGPSGAGKREVIMEKKHIYLFCSAGTVPQYPVFHFHDDP